MIFFALMMNIVEEREDIRYDYREIVEVFFDFLKQGFSVRDPDFETETLYFIHEQEIFELVPDMSGYDDVLQSCLKFARYNKFEEIVEVFVKFFGLKMEDFMKVYNIFVGLQGGSNVFVRFYPRFFELNLIENYYGGQMREISFGEILVSREVNETLKKVDLQRVYQYTTQLKEVRVELNRIGDLQCDPHIRKGEGELFYKPWLGETILYSLADTPYFREMTNCSLVLRVDGKGYIRSRIRLVYEYVNLPVGVDFEQRNVSVKSRKRKRISFVISH